MTSTSSDDGSCCERGGRRLQGVGSGDRVVTWDSFDRPMSDRDLLCGFKVNTLVGESPYKQRVFEAQRILRPVKYSYTKESIFEELDDYLELTNFAASVKLSLFFFPFVSMSGTVNYFRQRTSTKYKKTFLFQIHQVAYSKTIDETTIRIVEDAEELEGDELADQYGTQFVESIDYGAALQIRHTITASEEINVEKLDVGIRVTIGLFCFTFTINFKNHKQDPPQRYKVNTESDISVIGIHLLPPQNPTYNQTVDFINEFLETYNDTYNAHKAKKILFEENEDNGDPNILSQFSPVAFTLQSIATYSNNKFDYSDISIFNDRMKDVNDVLVSALYYKSELMTIRDKQEQSYTSTQQKFEFFIPYERTVNRFISRLDAKIQECYNYQKQPFSSIVRRAGTVSIAVPRNYPSTEEDVQEVNGILGKAYIPSPLSIGNTTFDNLHYIGFARRGIDGKLKPWIKGTIRTDDENKPITEPNSPSNLEMLAFAWENKISNDKNIDPIHIKYDEPVYLQLHITNRKVWLSTKVNDETRTIFTQEKENLNQTQYFDLIWNFRSYASNSTDPKIGQCLKYDDVVFIKKGIYDSVQGWLGYDSNNDKVSLFDKQVFMNQLDKKQQSRWIVRNAPHSDDHSNGFTDKDNQHCVQTNGKIYLQNQVHPSIWLLGGNGNFGNNVLTSNIHNDISNEIAMKSYQWIVRNNITDESEGFDCGAVSGEVYGKWIHLSPTTSSRGGGEDGKSQVIVEYSQGIVGRDSPFLSWKQSESWEKNVYESISAGFYFQVASSAIETSISQKEEAVNYIHSTMIAKNIEERGDLTNNPARLVEQEMVQKFSRDSSCVPWQFILEMTDACVPSWELRTGRIYCTDSVDEPPCCLPGFELHSGSLHGPCTLNSPCMCSDEICNPDSTPTAFPSYRQTDSPTSIVPDPFTSGAFSGRIVDNRVVIGISFLAMIFLNIF